MGVEGGNASATDEGKGGAGDGGPSNANNQSAGGGSGSGNAPSVEEANALLQKFKDAGVENPDGVLDLVKKLRDYEKGDKLPDHVAKELADLKSKAQAAEDAKLSETQRLQKRIEELEGKDKANEERAAKHVRDTAIVAAARTARAIDPEAMPALIDPSRLELNKAGEPTNLKDVFAELKKDKPVWFRDGKPGSFDGGARGRTPDGKVDMETALRSAAGH